MEMQFRLENYTRSSRSSRIKVELDPFGVRSKVYLDWEGGNRGPGWRRDWENDN